MRPSVATALRAAAPQLTRALLVVAGSISGASRKGGAATNAVAIFGTADGTPVSHVPKEITPVNAKMSKSFIMLVWREAARQSSDCHKTQRRARRARFEAAAATRTGFECAARASLCKRQHLEALHVFVYTYKMHFVSRSGVRERGF